MSKITVKSKSPHGFRRAGIAFNRDGVELDTAKLKKADLDAILNEPNLTVVDHAESASERKHREAAEKAAAEAAEKAAAEAAEQAAAEAAAKELAAREAAAAAKANGGDGDGKNAAPAAKPKAAKVTTGKAAK